MHLSSKIGLLVFLIVIAVPAYADWEGAISTDASGSEVSGKIRMKKNLVRADFKSPTDLSIIVNLATKKAWLLLHAPKLALPSDLSRVKDKVPLCLSTDVDVCLRSQGFKVKSKEKYEGHACAVYEKNDVHAETVTRVWRPTDLKEVPTLKTTVIINQSDGTKKQSETFIREIKMNPQQSKIFEVPSDFKKVPEGSIGG